MKIIGILLMTIALNIMISADAADTANRALLIHNSLKDINACLGKLKLKPVRVWGGDAEEDENKFFNTPSSVAVDKNGLLYVCDTHNHCVKIFESFSGKYLRTIGQFGKGPTDLYMPGTIALSHGGDIWVCETFGYRIQLFSPEGKSKKITKARDIPDWIGVTSKDNLAIYYHERAIKTGKLIAVFDADGKVLMDIGLYHDKSKNFLDALRVAFAMDGNDNIYTSYVSIPLIRKYAPDGVLLLAITFEYPFETEPVEITPNDRGDEINIVRENEINSHAEINGKGNITIRQNERKGKPRVGAHVIGVDAQKRVYAVTVKRSPTEKEQMATYISGGIKGLNRSQVDYNIVDKIEIYRLLVFSPEGKIIAEAQIIGYCDSMYINGNRLFIVDSLLNQRVMEYEMSFEQ